MEEGVPETQSRIKAVSPGNPFGENDHTLSCALLRVSLKLNPKDVRQL
jgi:hypothetical protein